MIDPGIEPGTFSEEIHLCERDVITNTPADLLGVPGPDVGFNCGESLGAAKGNRECMTGMGKNLGCWCCKTLVGWVVGCTGGIAGVGS